MIFWMEAAPTCQSWSQPADVGVGNVCLDSLFLQCGNKSATNWDSQGQKTANTTCLLFQVLPLCLSVDHPALSNLFTCYPLLRVLCHCLSLISSIFSINSPDIFVRLSSLFASVGLCVLRLLTLTGNGFSRLSIILNVLWNRLPKTTMGATSFPNHHFDHC